MLKTQGFGPDSIAIALHRERAMAAAAIQAAQLACARAVASGIQTRIIVTLDRADMETAKIARSLLGSADVIAEADFGDLGLSRNLAVAHARDGFVLLCDGDDLVGPDAVLDYARCMAGRQPERVVLHPEYVVHFGAATHITRQFSQGTAGFELNVMGSMNPWISSVFVHAAVVRRLPFKRLDPAESGFGFEDWQWHGEAAAAGMAHVCARGATHFVRVKPEGMHSLNRDQQALGVIPSRMGMRQWRRQA